MSGFKLGVICDQGIDASFAFVPTNRTNLRI
ncbi:hypothetical protein PRUB_b6003 [Pseudoalteromonas rubra]|uniref:Uncharacterized protein n=1 Tax=Pseudoalteromonas rubra TaxID=43658 RepID=A0A8T0BZM5_9GAMM|nr:hypothetical protein PRUB_b6003 [Pseudoalteromonas rubra]